jgi:hypothetical protein
MNGWAEVPGLLRSGVRRCGQALSRRNPHATFSASDAIYMRSMRDIDVCVVFLFFGFAGGAVPAVMDAAGVSCIA